MSFRLILSAAAFAAFPTTSVAQNPPTVALKNAACAGCTILLEKEVTLGDANGPGAFVQYSSAVTRGSRGHYLALDAGGAVPLLFDSSGKFIAAIGRKGEGPGEFNRASAALFGTGDSIVVTERGFLSVFTPSREIVRKVENATLGSSIFMRSDGNMFFTGSVRTPEATGFRYHIIASSGKVVRSFVPEPPPPSGRTPPAPFKLYSLAKTLGDFWSFNNSEYVFTLNDSLGRPRRVFSGFTPAWLTANGERGLRAALFATREDSRRILWVLGLVPAPGAAPMLPDSNGNVFAPSTFVGLRIGVLDAIDLDTGAILASTRLPSMTQCFVDDQRVAVLVETSAGFPRTEIWRFSLSGFTR